MHPWNRHPEATASQHAWFHVANSLLCRRLQPSQTLVGKNPECHHQATNLLDTRGDLWQIDKNLRNICKVMRCKFAWFRTCILWLVPKKEIDRPKQRVSKVSKLSSIWPNHKCCNNTLYSVIRNRWKLGMLLNKDIGVVELRINMFWRWVGWRFPILLV